MSQSDLARVLAVFATEPSFQDTLVVCQDGPVSAPRAVLALAFPSLLARLLAQREDKRLVVFIPDMLAHQIRLEITALFTDNSDKAESAVLVILYIQLLKKHL